MSIQVSNLHVSTKSKVTGKARVSVLSRSDSQHSGQFKVSLAAIFDPSNQEYPSGKVKIDTDLSDSVRGAFTSTSIEQINSFGKHTPTIFITGKCKVQVTAGEPLPVGSRFWLMIANNKSPQSTGTADVVSFVVFDRTGTRVAYGTGSVGSGDFEIVATGD